MKISHIFICIGLAIGLASCGTVRKTSVTLADVETGVQQYPTVTDLTVLPKIEKTLTWNWRPFKFDDLKLIKNNFMFDVLKEASADVLLEYQYNYTKTPYGERKLTITGYPAQFKDFRKATSSDLEALRVLNACDHKCKQGERIVYNVAKSKKERKNKE